MTRFLTLDDALAAAEAYLGRRPEVRDYGLLESALLRPQTTVFGEDAYPSLDLRAAALLSSVVRNHALVDGNKRLGWVSTRLFYIYNGHDIRANHDDAYELVISIASGDMDDIEKVSATLARWR